MDNKTRAIQFSTWVLRNPHISLASKDEALEAQFNEVESRAKEQGPTWDFLYSIMDKGEVQHLADRWMNRDGAKG